VVEVELEELSRAECLALLSQASMGRIGLSVKDLPVILPVNFALVSEQIVVRTVTGTKLSAATAQKVVAFEADGYDPGGAWGWSVMVQGIAREITDPSDLARARALPLRAWAFEDGVADRLVSIDVGVVSGRSFGHPPALSVRSA
jgi:nitroimidazol reductase NimA-like FMN-containing flavoprotein (pyridoxamine 5'-phosphate oxidase superfamily)